MRDRAEEAIRASPDAAVDEAQTRQGNGGGDGRGSSVAVEPDRWAAGRRGGGVSIRNLRTFTSLKNPVFRLYFGAMLGQFGAMNMQMVARGLLIFLVSDSALILGLMAAANGVPMLCFALFGGVAADRLPKKYLLLAGQLCSAIVALAVALSISFGYLSEERPDSWWILIIASLAQGTILGLMMPSRHAMIADIVGEEQLMNAVALNTFGMNTLRLMAPAIAGFLIAAFGFQAIYYTMTGLYLMAVAFILPMPRLDSVNKWSRRRTALADLKEGLKYVWHESTIIIILVITLFITLLSMPYMFLMPVFTEDILDVGAGGLGLLMSVSGVGAMMGSLVLASLPNRKRGAMLVVGGLIMALALVAFSASEWFYLSLGLMVFVGVGQTMRMTLGNTLIMYYVEPVYRGRVMSLMMMEFGLMQFGVLLAGLMADLYGIQLAIGGMAAVLAGISILTLAFVPRIRKLE